MKRLILYNIKKRFLSIKLQLSGVLTRNVIFPNEAI